MRIKLALWLVLLLVLSTPASGNSQAATGAAVEPHIGAPCIAPLSRGLAEITHGYLRGDDHYVLAAALRAERTTRVCGDERDSVSFELIAATTFDRIGDRRGGCAALRDAARRTARFADDFSVRRSVDIRDAAAGCNTH